MPTVNATARMTKPRLLFLKTPEELTTSSEAMLNQARTILHRIVRVQGKRTVANTLVPFNELSNLVSQVSHQTGVLFSVHPVAAVRDAANKAYLAADGLSTELSLNRPLYEAFVNLEVSKADAETKYAVWKILRDFRRAGVDRDEATRARVKALTDEISDAEATFIRTLGDDLRTVDVREARELDGLPADYVARHGPDADGRIRITTAWPDAFPVFQYAKNADLRRRLQREFLDLGYPKNLGVLRQLLEKRHELARLLRYEHHAAYVTEGKMIGSSKAAADFVERLAEAARGRAKKDLELMVARKQKDNPRSMTLDPWDPDYYAELVRVEQYRFNSQDVRPYLSFGRVRDGLFKITGQLFGLTYRRVKGVPVWHGSVEVYDVYRAGRRLGRFYLDLHPRDGKAKDGFTSPLVVGLKGIQLPQEALVCNFPDPHAAKGPTLMEHRDVVIFFHEFGHLLHGIFSGRSRWLKTSITGIESDFVEAPSQMLEEWARRPESLQRFARHHETGEPIPRGLVERMERALTVDRGLSTSRAIYRAALSLAYYSRDPTGMDTTALAQQFNLRYYPVPWHEGTHYECSFVHLADYSALYYTYLWSLVIAKDLYSEFAKAKSMLDPKLAARYRRTILEAASRRPAADMIEQFLGRPLRFNAFRSWLNDRAS